MKKTYAILIILNLLIWGLFFSLTTRAQFHLSAGFVDISKKLDGSAVTTSLGYSHFKQELGLGINMRNTSTMGEVFYSLESTVKYRMGERGHRFEVGGGAGYNLDDQDVYPVIHIRNAFRLDDIVWLALDLDNSFRISKKRSETYFQLVVLLDGGLLEGKRRKKRFF